MQKPRTFFVTVYKDDDAFYPAGQSRMIHCNHMREQDCGITTERLIVPIPSATEIPGTADTTDAQVGTVMVLQGTIFDSPTQFADSSYKAVTRIKDMVTLVTSYVSTSEYETNVVACFPSTHN